ncbi:hypothetical protein N9C86_00800 [Schleiferiaceae bacterium]|nr:hypothetical protein [Schleiferiaceae bacterium]
MNSLSKFFVTVLFLFTIAPIVVFFRFNPSASTGGLFLYLYQFIVIIVGLSLKGKVLKNHKPIYVNKSLVNGVLIMLILIPFSILVLEGGLSNWNINPELVYDYRNSNSNKVVLTGFLAYLTMWSLVIFANYLIVYYFISKQYNRVLILVLFYFLWYGMTGHKSFLMYPVFSIFVFFILKHKEPSYFLLRNLSLFIGVAYIVDNIFFPLPFLTSTFTRRLLFIPANTAFAYYDYFGQQGFLYWSNSFLKSFIDYEHSVSPALLIGKYMGDSTMVANNSFLSTGYMHFGFLGATIYSVMFVFLIKSLPGINRTKASIAKVAIISLPIFQLITSSDFLTTLLTHGLAIGLFVIMITKAPSYEDSCNI